MASSGQYQPGSSTTAAVGHVVSTVLGGLAIAVTSALATRYYYKNYPLPQQPPKMPIANDKTDTGSSSSSAYESLVGHTPLVKLRNLSQLLQRDVYVKMECMNPGGTGKDRAALGMIRAAERNGQLPSPREQAQAQAQAKQVPNPHNNQQNCSSKAPSPSSSSSSSMMETIIPPGRKITDDLLDAVIDCALRQSRTGGHRFTSPNNKLPRWTLPCIVLASVRAIS